LKGNPAVIPLAGLLQQVTQVTDGANWIRRRLFHCQEIV